MEINFYHITLSKVEQPLLALLVRLYRTSNERILVCLPDKNQCENFSHLLWGFQDTAFIPHITREQYLEDKSDKEFLEAQRIVISEVMDNMIQATICLSMPGVDMKEVSFKKMAYFFAGYDTYQNSIARKDWQYFQSKNYKMLYQKQLKDKKWERIEPCF